MTMIIYSFRLLCVRFHVIFSITKSIDVDDDNILIQNSNEHAIFIIYIIKFFRSFLTTFYDFIIIIVNFIRYYIYNNL